MYIPSRTRDTHDTHIYHHHHHHHHKQAKSHTTTRTIPMKKRCVFPFVEPCLSKPNPLTEKRQNEFLKRKPAGWNTKRNVCEGGFPNGDEYVVFFSFLRGIID